MKQLWQIAGFLRELQAELRFGDFAHAPLKLLRFQLQDETAECDWVARSADEWDGKLPRRAREQKASMEALQDAMKLRDMLFSLLPGISQAVLRVFRQTAREPPRLIIAGTVTRQLSAVKKVKSPVMRAKLYGFKFWMDDGVLVPLESVERSFGFAT
jgi:hypothetical protein